MADCAFTLTREEQIAYIKIESRRGKGAPESLMALEEVVPTSVLAYNTIRRWVRELNNGRSDVSKKHLCERPVSATDGKNVEKVAKLLNDDRRYTCTEIAHELDISHGSAHSILTDRLNMRKVAARWMPHMLSDSEKHHQVKIARSLLHRYGEEGGQMLQRIVTIDETWIRSFEPELKRQSSEWHTRDSPRPLKFRRSQNCPKMLMIFAYNFRGVLTAHRVPTGRTVNKEYYEKYLRTVLRPALRRKRSELINCTPRILHDNVSPHKSNVVNALLEGYGWECSITSLIRQTCLLPTSTCFQS